MSSYRATIADAVKTALNAAAAANPAQFVLTFTATRAYLPLIKLEDTDSTLRVTVVPTGEDRTVLSRKAVLADVEISIGIQQRLPATVDPSAASGNTWLDVRSNLAEQIARFFEPGGAGDPTLGGAAAGLGNSNAARNRPVFFSERLQQLREFASVIIVTFRRAL